MIRILVKKADGNYWRPSSYSDLSYGFALNAGCTGASFKIPATRDLPAQLDRLEIWDNLTRLWVGQIEDLPEDSTTGERTVVGLGYPAYFKELAVARLWSDQGYNNWDTQASETYDASWNVGSGSPESDNNNRLWMKFGETATLPGQAVIPWAYRLCDSDRVNQAIYSVTFNWGLGAGATAAFTAALNSYASGVTTPVTEWSQAGNGGLQSGSATITVTANKKSLVMLVYNTGAVTVGANCYLKITNIRVNGLTGFTGNYQADDVITNSLTAYASEISTDVTDIAAGTFNLPSFYEEGGTLFDTINKANEYEDFHWGIYEVSETDDKPRMRYKAFARGTIDYTLDQTMGKLSLSGSTLEDVYNAVRVKYKTADGKETSVTRTASVAVLTAAGRTKTAEITVDTSSLAMAQQAGDIFLDEHGRPKLKGEFVAVGNVYHNLMGFQPAERIRPGEIIHIRDLDPTPETLTEMASVTNVLNGRNIFLVTAVDVDDDTGQVKLQLDASSNRLDVFLTRKRIA